MSLNPIFLLLGSILIVLFAGVDLIAPVVQNIAQRIGKKLLVLAIVLPMFAAAQTKTVGTVMCCINEPGHAYTYAITAGNTTKFFSIDNTGLLTVDVNAYTTFVRQRTFYLTVKVTGDGKVTQPDGTVKYEAKLWKKAKVTVVLKKTSNSSGIIINSSELIYQI
jgi:hypothetical protein